MNLPPPKYRKIIPLVLLPVALLLFARERASWRPHNVGIVGYVGADAPTISPDGNFAAAIDGGGIVALRLYDLSTGQVVRTHRIQRSISSMTFSPKGGDLAVAQSIASGSADAQETNYRQKVSLWETDGTFRDFEMSPAKIRYDDALHLRFSPDGKTLWLASTNNLFSWDVTSGKRTFQLFGADKKDVPEVFAAVLDPHCRLFFRATQSDYSVWDVQKRKCLLNKKLPILYDKDLYFSPDGSFLTYMTNTAEGEIYVMLDARTGQELWRPGSIPTFVGDRAIIIQDKSLHVYDARSGKFLSRLPHVPDATLLPTDCEQLYSITNNCELFRQRAR